MFDAAVFFPSPFSLFVSFFVYAKQGDLSKGIVHNILHMFKGFAWIGLHFVAGVTCMFAWGGMRSFDAVSHRLSVIKAHRRKEYKWYGSRPVLEYSLI